MEGGEAKDVGTVAREKARVETIAYYLEEETNRKWKKKWELESMVA
jgi:hypothetical protein